MLFDLDKETFNEKVLQQKGLVLVDFWAPWCRGCQSLELILENISDDFFGRLHIYKVDVSEHEDLADLYEVTSLPTLVLFNDGRKEKTLVSLQSENTIKEWLNL